MVLDTHTHAWTRPSRAHPWVNGPLVETVETFSTETVYDAEALQQDMDAIGVDKAVVVGYPICEWTDNAYTIECAAEYEDLYGIVMLDQFADDAAAQLREAMATDDVLGFRLGAICPYDRMWETFDPDVSWLEDAIDEPDFWEAAHDTDALVQLLAHVDQLEQVVDLVETYPDLSYALDHFCHAGPDVTPEEALAPLEPLASDEYDVAIKISEVVHRSEEDFPYTDMHDHVTWLLETFGRERVVWGSDFPNVSDEAAYEESLAWLEHVDTLSTKDRNWLTERSFAELAGL
ncbi:amidohydrolase family protein [Natronolimnobius baerhuensis]|uniref:Amidohydrolase n=1 Tax=Natronolimnobius baerhuensis TaxID=253108 RepID=A0A202ECA9_9EURY|nr:amidohydrolase family protein [Natronolimnobius baerhuensis]OVE85828.1 amidohydrolase [Natronolimnobius baerhuensis]